jgi:hypothetical protein
VGEFAARGGWGVLAGASTVGIGVQVAGTSTADLSLVTGGGMVCVASTANSSGLAIACSVGARVGNRGGMFAQPLSKNKMNTRTGMTGVNEAEKPPLAGSLPSAENLSPLKFFIMVPVIVPGVSQRAISHLY